MGMGTGMDDANEEEMALHGVDAEIKELLGLFDVPAFARRGQDVEHALARLRSRALRQRATMLEMVRIRLRQRAAAAHRPGAEPRFFRAPIAPLWPLVGAEPPRWSARAA